MFPAVTRAQGALVCVAVILGAIAQAAPSRAASTFSASAGADLASVLVRARPAVLQDNLLDPGAVSAQASITSFGESTAFASNPYPGSIPMSAPGLLNALIAMDYPELEPLVHVPDYPFYASSSYPATPTASVVAGPMSLTAESRRDEAHGVATDGVSRTDARVSVDASDVVTATATTEIGPIDGGPLLSISGARSRATAVRGAGGTVERSSEFSVLSMSVLGQSIRIGPNGFELAGVRLPFDVGSLLSPVDDLLADLANTGTSIRLLPSTDTADGVISGGIEVSQTVNTGAGLTVTVVVTYGRAFAAVSNTARRPLGTTPLPTSTPAASAGEHMPPAGGSAFVPGSSLTPSSAPTGPSVSQPVSSVGAARGLQPDTTEAGRFYPVLVVVGAALALGFTTFRKMEGVAGWMS